MSVARCDDVGRDQNESSLVQFIRGPTHITQTDVWISRGGTLSLSKRRGDYVNGIDVGRRFEP
jgi:hypothetical protein